MKVLALLFGKSPATESACLEDLRTKRLAELEALLAEIAEQPCENDAE